MTERDFNVVIERLKKTNENERKLNSLGINLIDINDSYYYIINILFESIFGKEKNEVLSWFLWEFRSECMKITDSKTGKVLYDLEKEGQLWKFLNDK